LSDSFRRTEDLVGGNNELQKHYHKFKVCEQQNVQIFIKVYRTSEIIMSILNLADFSYVDINDSWIRAFGYSRQEVVGCRYSALPLWLNPVWDEEKYQELKESHGLQSYEVQYRSKDGSIGFGLVSSQLIIIDDHRFSLNTMIDITSRKQAEIEQHKSEESLKNILCTLGSISDPFYAVDVEWRLIYVNQKAQDWWQRSQEELLGKLLWEMIREPEKPRIYKQICTAMRERITVHYETFSVKMASWFEVSIYPTGNGGLSFYFKDITARKQAERALKESEERHRTLTEKLHEVELAQSKDQFYKVFNLNPDMIVIMNMEDNTYIEGNQAALDTYGFTREEAIGSSAIKLGTSSPDDPATNDFIEQLKLHGTVKDVELTTRDRLGKRIDVLISSILINLDDKQCRLSILKDVSEKKRYEKELARLDRLNLIGQMAASIGHEIRNPMTSVRGFLQMFNEQDNTGDNKVYYELMIEELDRANGIITEFLNLARDKPCDLQAHCLNSIINRIQPMIEAEARMYGKQIQVIPGRDLQLMLDENEIRQLILNLVRNGMEAMNPGGTVTISTQDSENEAILCIKDQGPGIDPEYLERIGTPFVTSKENGVGLGLAVCYSIAARHGARIDFDTGPAGTTFRVCFSKNLQP
jgi:PAS domain S-box-containing protein